MWLTPVVLLLTLICFNGELIVLVVQLVVFDGFLNHALLEDGEEEITLVGEYFCSLSFLAVRGFGVSYL